MMATLKGFVKLECELCVQRMDLTENQLLLMRANLPQKALTTWHFNAINTVPTVDCTVCRTYPALVDKRKPEIAGDKRRVSISDAQLAPLEEKWKGNEGPVRDGQKFMRGPDSFLTMIGMDDGLNTDIKVDPLVILCSFCKKPTSRITAHSGVSSLDISKEVRVLQDDPRVEQTITTVKAKKVIACSECAHRIRPLMHRGKDGKEEIKLSNSNGYSEG